MSEGELQGKEHDLALVVRALILAEPDVHRLIALEQNADGEWVYFIETPFATFPRFVVGITDAANNSPKILAKSSAEWGCRETFDMLAEK